MLHQTSIGAQARRRPSRISDRVWVLDDPFCGADSRMGGQALALAERLGVPFRRIPLAWQRGGGVLRLIAAHAAQGSLLGLGRGSALPFGHEPELAAGPALVISSGARAAPVGLWLRARFGCQVVHCGPVPRRHDGFDLLIAGRHERGHDRPGVLAVTGTAHRISPLALSQARTAWAERLAHLPRPLVVLLADGRLLPAGMAHALGARMAGLARAGEGSVAAVTGRAMSHGVEAALVAGLGPAVNMVCRWDDPGPDPYCGLLAHADVVVVTGDCFSMAAEACAAPAPVFLAMPQLAGPAQRRLHQSLVAHGGLSALGDTLAAVPRQPLDETGRAASEMRRHFALALTRMD